MKKKILSERIFLFILKQMGLMKTWLMLIFILFNPLLDFQSQKRNNAYFSYMTYVLNTTCLQHTVQNTEECKIASPESKTYLNF